MTIFVVMGDLDRGAREAVGLVVFALGGQSFALLARDVRELVRAVAVTPLPKAPPIIEGVINARGRIVPVLDVRARFGLPAKPLEPSDHMIVADAGSRVVALRADRATDLVQVAHKDIETAEAMPYVAGIAKLPDGIVVIHDLRTFLSASEAAELDAAS